MHLDILYLFCIFDYKKITYGFKKLEKGTTVQVNEYFFRIGTMVQIWIHHAVFCSNELELAFIFLTLCQLINF